MSFEFINNAAIDRVARKRIRSHVAMGKNAGKKLVRSRKRPVGMRREITSPTIRPPNVQDIDSSEYSASEDSGANISYEIERQVGDSIFGLSFAEFDIGDKRIVQRAFSFVNSIGHPPELKKALIASRISTFIFVQFMALDEACLHCGVAVAITALNNLVVNQEDPKTAMNHLSRAFRLINDKLSGNDAVSDTSIAVVLTMSHYYRLQGLFRQGLVHLLGLERMVRLRGGIEVLKREQFTLAQKIFRADLEYSLHLGTATQYPVHGIESKETFCINNTENPDLYKVEVQNLSSTQWFPQLSTTLRSLLLDTIYFARLLNDANIGRGSRLNGYTLHNTLVFLGYHLLSLYPLGDFRPITISPIENAVHLGLTAFVTTFIRGFDGKVPENLLLAGLIRSSVRELVGKVGGCEEVLLWLMCIGRASVLGDKDDLWLVRDVNYTMHTLGLRCWDDVQRMLEKFPWVNVLHDKEGKGLLHSVEESYCDTFVISRSSTDSHHHISS